MFKNRALMILMLVMLVNALSYGTIIPLLYPYTARFGVGPFLLSLLFASFSLAQFIATPIIGRLSDKYGRKPLLLLCLFGTGLSQILMAIAGSLTMVFVARILDGITGGNNSVAQAMVADVTEGSERAKAFGLLGAAMGAGFLIGPAIGGLIGQLGLTAPFWFSAALAIGGTVIGQIWLPESVVAKVEAKKEPMFRLGTLVKVLTSPSVGLVLGVSFLTMLALNMFILGFQTFTVDVLGLNTTQVGLQFALFGLVSVIMQAGGIRVLLNLVHNNKIIIMTSLIGSGAILLLLSLTNTLMTFTSVLFIFMVLSSPQLPLITALISERTKAEDQGGLLGINQSYVSLAQIIGPIAGGVIASQVSVAAVFAVSGAIYGLAALAGRWLFLPVKTKADI